MQEKEAGSAGERKFAAPRGSLSSVRERVIRTGRYGVLQERRF